MATRRAPEPVDYRRALDSLFRPHRHGPDRLALLCNFKTMIASQWAVSARFWPDSFPFSLSLWTMTADGSSLHPFMLIPLTTGLAILPGASAVPALAPVTITAFQGLCL